jgi:excisionase family DNA binding protein
MENQITATIPEFCRMTGIGRSSVYELISEGAIHSITMGRRRLIVIESYRALVARKRAEEQQQANGRPSAASASIPPQSQKSGSRPSTPSRRASRAS